VASVISAFIVGPLGANPSHYFANFDLLNFATSALMLEVPSVPDVFVGQPYPLVNGALWTISREFSCYLIVLALGLVAFCAGGTLGSS
jgi:peptidoglycan/LPS O-acetylase OafA/YrhL